VGVVARQLGATIWQVGLLSSIPFFGHLLSFFWASRQARFASPLAFVSFANAVTRVLFLGMAWVQGPTAFVACACLAQFLAPVHSPAYTEVMRQIYPEEIRGKAMGSVRMALSVATMLAAALGGKLLDVVGFRMIFPIAAVAGVAAAWIFSQLPYPVRNNEARRTQNISLAGLSQLLKGHPELRRFEVGFFLFGFGNLMFNPLLPILLVDNFSASNFFVGQLAFVTALTRLGFLYFWGHRVDREGGILVCREVFLLTTFVPLLYAIAPGRGLLFLAAAIFGCAMAGLELAVISSMITFAKGGDPTATMAVHQTILGIRGIAAPMVGAALLQIFGLPATFLIASAIILTGIPFLRRLPADRP
jgi:MFS family permease